MRTTMEAVGLAEIVTKEEEEEQKASIMRETKYNWASYLDLVDIFQNIASYDEDDVRWKMGTEGDPNCVMALCDGTLVYTMFDPSRKRFFFSLLKHQLAYFFLSMVSRYINFDQVQPMKEFYTNRDLYTHFDPDRVEMPYVYDNFQWPHCEVRAENDDTSSFVVHEIPTL